MQIPRLVPVLACASWVAAQSVAVVPAGLASRDAPGQGRLAGATFALRQQIVVGATQMRALAGKKLLGLWLRRDAADKDAFAGGLADLEIRIASSSSLDANGPSPQFAANLGPRPVRVFKGRVTIPFSPKIVPPYDPWGLANTIRITFQTPFSYAGGTLCIDVAGQPVAGRRTSYWGVDFDEAPGSGAVRVLGASCTRVPLVNAATASAWAGSLRPGGTAIFAAHGRPGTLGTLILGTNLLGGGNGIALGPFGARGCTLLVAQLADLSARFGPPLFAGGTSYVTANVYLPNQPRLLAARVFSQWVHLEWPLPRHLWTNALGVTTSNAVEARLAATPVRAGLATIAARIKAPGALPATGTVHIARAPVLRIVAR